MAYDKIVLTEKELIEKLKRFIDEGDSLDLSRLAGDVFGGICESKLQYDSGGFFSEILYNFYPIAGAYYGALDNCNIITLTPVK